MKVKFPKQNSSHRCYGAHFKYVLDLLKYTNTDIEMVDVNTDVFETIIDGKKVLFDNSDFSKPIQPATDNNEISFKFHYEEHLKNNPKIIPFAPISFHDWNQYYELEKEIKYTCNTDLVLNKQRAYAGAKARRGKIRNQLQAKYGNNVDLNFKDSQVDFWNKINNCLVAVFVPGATNNMIDRANLQMFGFGCCTISPNLPEILPYNNTIIPDVHYIRCEDDYSDLINKIEWCKSNRDKCIEIGNNAKEIFQKCCTPDKLIEWIKEKL
jgi:hypothetical protein